tara:strand:+ start:36694 stop:37092 length:399 start_codon:yes stop_codon:yes gene_type:complete
MTVKIDQAFVADFVAGAYGIAIVHENTHYEPTPGTPYAELLVLQNDQEAQSLVELNDTTGIFRVILRYPTNKGAGPAKVMADSILSTFKVGSAHTYSGVTARVRRTKREPGYPEDGWYKMVLTMSYHALLTR